MTAYLNRNHATQDMKEVFIRQGAEPEIMSPTKYAATIKSEIEGWKKVAKDANIKAE